MLYDIHLRTSDSLIPTDVLVQINNVWVYRATMGRGFHHYSNTRDTKSPLNPWAFIRVKDEEAILRTSLEFNSRLYVVFGLSFENM